MTTPNEAWRTVPVELPQAVEQLVREPVEDGRVPKAPRKLVADVFGGREAGAISPSRSRS